MVLIKVLGRWVLEPMSSTQHSPGVDALSNWAANHNHAVVATLGYDVEAVKITISHLLTTYLKQHSKLQEQ